MTNIGAWYSLPEQTSSITNPKLQYQYSATTTPIQLNASISHKTKMRACIDSAASADMIPLKCYFESITYYDPTDASTPSVMLGDETTLVPIVGYGLAKYSINNKTIRKRALYVPALGATALLSVKQHMENKGCYFHAESQKTTLAFPTFLITPSVDKEIDVILQPSTASLDFDELKTQQVSTKQKSTEHPRHHLTTNQQQYNFVHHDINNYPIIPETKTVFIKKLSPQAQLPAQGTPGSIGFDVTSTTTIQLLPNTPTKIPTGLATAFPSDMYLRIASRSSMAMKHIQVQGGVVDSDYRGEIQVILNNQSPNPITIQARSKIAQFIFEKAEIPLLQQVTQLPLSTRGEKGFGSTNSNLQPHQGAPNSRIKTFRLDDHQLLIYDTSKRIDTAKRVAAPIRIPLVHPNDLQYWNHPDRLNKNTNNSNITVHTMDLKNNTKPDPILQMDIQHISSNPVDHQVQPSTDLIPATITPVYRPNSSQSSFVTMSNSDLLQSIGFLKPDKMLKHLKRLGQNNFSISKLPRNPVLDPGETATKSAAPRNTTPSETPEQMRKIWHIDIGFGPCNAIGGIKYTLLAVNKKTRTNLVFGLKNLTTSLLHAMQEFLLTCGPTPEIIRTDFDAKLIRGEVKQFLLSKQITIQASPPYRQHQNGLVERHWQTLVAMTRNWLTSAQLPSKYWFFCIKRACEVLNMLPIDIDGRTTTPFQEMYRTRVDYRNLFPMLAVAYIKQTRAEGIQKSKWKAQTLKCILVGSCKDSDSLLFYHPPSKQVLSCNNGYTIDSFSPAGSHFNENFDGNFIFNTQSDLDTIHRPPEHDTNKIVFYQDESQQFIQCKVIEHPYDETEPYTLQEVETSNIIQLLSCDILESNPTETIVPTEVDRLTNIPWINHNSKVTILLQQYNFQPKQGYLQYDNTTQVWSFLPGRKKSNPQVILNNFNMNAESMIQNKKLFQGWKSAHIVMTARRVQATSNTIASLIINGKVSAKDLQSMKAPTLLKHYQLSQNDKLIWDAAYKAEYDGLVNIKTWELITEEEYLALKAMGKGGIMPTMAITTIKTNGKGQPVRAKYRIVALGNLDPNQWSTEDCFAPVLSQLELRFLIALAVQNKCIPKTGDIQQAFCQSTLPDTETYICTPPAGCPLTPKGLYLKLRKTLYGLKRSPRHFYDLAKKLLLEIGFTPHPNSPCLFIGHLIPNEPPIYLGLYVDDFIYFSKSKAVEEKFEKAFDQKIDIDWNGQIDYFLGIQFQCKRHENNDVSILLSQEAFIDTIINSADLQHDDITTPKSPYRSGYPIDKIPTIEQDKANQSYVDFMQKFIGSLNWLSISTRPDISTITNMLAKYTVIPSKGHIDAVKRVIRYLKGTKTKGILFTTAPTTKISAYVKFPVPSNNIVSMCDSNWGPQDQSVPKQHTPPKELPLFHSRSVSGYLLWLGGPLHWISKRQSITARSSAEAEIYATDECTKALLHLSFIVEGFQLTSQLMQQPTTVYNDNSACITWSKSLTTKGLRHLQMRENAVRESVQNGFIETRHCQGKYNLSDMFTKEDKDTLHFIEIRDHIMADSIPIHEEHKHMICAKRAFSVTYASTSLLYVSEGGVSTDVQTDPVE
jgi:deoxyuridine 5'-triphosphate nucleotidohydrolase